MRRSPVLRDPGRSAEFEPNSNSAVLSSEAPTTIGGVFEITEDNWRQILELYHELAHFYQFTTTTWGLLHQLWGRAEFLWTSGFLFESGRQPAPVRLPLLESVTADPLEDLFDRSDPRALLRSAYLADRLRRYIFGYESAPEIGIPAEDDEWRFLGGLAEEMLGIPNTHLREVPAALVGERKNTIYDFLESHAHVLSIVWMIQVGHLQGVDPKIIDKAVDYADAQATGRYSKFLDPALDLPGEHYLSTFCVLCDVALNPHVVRTGVGYVAIRDVDFSPTDRMVRLLNFALGSGVGIAWSGEDRAPIEEYLDLLRSATQVTIPPYGSQMDVRPIIDKLAVQYKTERLTDVALDLVGCFAIAERLRNEHQPVLLGGVSATDLALLVERIGVPSLVNETNGNRNTNFRICQGLRETPFADDLLLSATESVPLDLAVVSTITTLLTRSKPELELDRQEQPLGGDVWGVDRTLELWNLTPDSFV